MELDNLRAFISVAEQRSFSRAAERLHITQPAVSKRISALEAELDTLLFDRLGHKILLTEAGKALIPRARRILLEVEDSKRAVANLTEERHALTEVPGIVPGLREFGKDRCLFASRCSYRSDECLSKRPPGISFENGQVADCWHAEAL